MDNCFVDSTVWVEFFKGTNNRIRDSLIPLIDEDRIFYNGIILCDLLTGALTKKDFDFLVSGFGGFHCLDMSNNLFKIAGQLGFTLRRKGVTVPVSDLVIAAHCLEHQLTLWTLDNHYIKIAKHSDLRIKEFSSD